MADDKIKAFCFTWNLTQFFSSWNYISEFRSPKIRVCATNYVQFCLSYESKEAFEIKIEKNDDLDMFLGECNLSHTNSSATFSKKQSSQIPGWLVQWNLLNGKTMTGDLKIIIQLFLRKHLSSNPTISTSNSFSFKKLSRDMEKLLNTGELSDFNLVIGTQEFKVHRAIIAARAPKLADVLQLGETSRFITRKKVTSIPVSVLKFLLRYLYSSEFTFSQTDFPLGFSTTLDEFKLDDIKSKLYTYPDQTSVSTHLKTVTHSFVWPLKYFNTMAPGMIINSPIIHLHHQYELQLKLRKGTIVDLSGNETVDVALAFDTNYERENCHLQFDTCFVDVFGDCSHPRTFDVGETEWHTVLSVERSQLILHPEDTLSLSVKLTMRKVENEIVESESSTSLEGFCSHPSDLMNLSSDLYDLYQSGNFSDLTVQAGHRKFKVHKAIIFARSPKLFEAFQTSSSNWAETDIEPFVLEKLFEYIYSGKSVQSDCTVATKLYLSAYKYDLSPLKVNCLDYIKSNISFK